MKNSLTKNVEWPYKKRITWGKSCYRGWQEVVRKLIKNTEGEQIKYVDKGKKEMLKRQIESIEVDRKELTQGNTIKLWSGLEKDFNPTWTHVKTIVEN